MIIPWINAWIVSTDIARRLALGYAFIMDNELPSDLGKRVGNLDDLPESLRAQLQVGKIGNLEREIIALIRDELDGVANVDEILVGLYRRTGEVHERQPLANRLYRMGQAGHLTSVPRKKGVYRTKYDL